jgi:hypothetical protein
MNIQVFKISEIILILKKWEGLYFEFQKKNKCFREIFGDSAESPLLNLYWDLWRAYTDEVAFRVGDEKKDEHGYNWLGWYEFECQMGKTPNKAATSDGKLIAVGSIDVLAKMIYATCSYRSEKRS